MEREDERCLGGVADWARQSTNIQRLMAEFPGKFAFSVSHTTRLPRPGEQDGVQYHFTTVDRFKGR